MGTRFLLTRRATLGVAAILAFAAGTLSGGGAAQGQTITNLAQHSVVTDGTSYPFTEYGSFDISYTGSAVDQYLNVTYNGQWVIQNMPLMGREGVGFTTTESFSFPLGISRGTNLTGLSPGSFNAVVTTGGLGGMPSPAGTSLTFNQRFSNYSQGTIPSPFVGVLPFLNAPLVGITGAAPAMLMKGGHKNFPNQDSRPFACAPTAVSNSLQFLKAQNPGAGWGSLPLDTTTMEGACNYGVKMLPGGGTATGCWIFPDATRPAGQRNAWWQDKNNYMIANGYPIMTMMTTSLSDMLTAVKAGKDVEIEMEGHTAAIVGMADLGMGNYSIQIAHDLDQNNPGGQAVDTLKWNNTTMKFEGGTWGNGRKFNYAVIEMVPTPSSATALVLGGLLIGRRRRRA